MRNCKPTYLVTALLPVCIGLGCTNTDPDVRPEVHGHRGCRGLLPENTVPAFLKAAELGCDWLEMDVVVTGDGAVLVSHEPWMEHRICRTGEGGPITAQQERAFNIYRMSLAEVQDFDCGSARHPDFPDQRNSDLHKPTLAEVVEAVENEAMVNGWGLQNYNIEIKSEPSLYDVYQPRPQPFAERVLAAIDSLGIDGQCVIQSFDPAVLEAVHTLSPDMPTALLVDNTAGLEANLQRLSFVPTYYSADLPLVDAALVTALRARGILPLVWTVNEPRDMERMIALGVNGIITDRPDRLIALEEGRD